MTFIEKYTRVILLLLFLFLGLVLAHILYDRFEARQNAFRSLDEKSLALKINQMEKRTSALQEARELNPVWENWRLAKDIAATYGMQLKAAKENKKRNSQGAAWVGELTGEPLLVLATAKKIQQKVAAQIISLEYMESRARLELAVLGISE